MKKIIAILTLVFILSGTCACTKAKKNDTNTQTAAPQTDVSDKVSDDKNDKGASETESTENKKDNSERPVVYWASKDRESSDVSYHKKDCPIIKDKEPQELSWEMIDALGMPPCTECKPDSK